MRNWKIMALAAAVSTGTALLASCGGSSDNKSSDATKSARAAAPLAAKALTVGALGSRAQDRMGRVNKSAPPAPTMSAAAPEQDLNSAVARFQRGSATNGTSARATSAQALAASICTSGKVTPSGDTLVYENCEYVIGDSLYFEDGTITYASVDSGDSSSFTFSAGTAQKPYVLRESKIGTMKTPIFEMSITADVTGTNSGKVCASVYNVGYSTSTVKMTGEFRVKEYSGTVANADFTLKAAGLSEAVSVAKFDTAKCDPLDVTVTENGSIALTDHVSGTDASMVASNLAMHSVVGMNTDMQKILTTSLTGTVDVKSPCFTGSLTFTTIEDIVQLMDDGEADGCPIAGKLALSGSVVGTVKYTATGGVEIDNGSDGTVDQTFKSCEDANICS